MPGLPLEQFDRTFQPASGVIVDTPVLYEVWREYAISDPEAREGMRTGRVPRRWAEKEHPAWVGSEDET